MFDFLRDQVGLDLIVFANGSGKARCVSPDHQDEDPSMHLYNDHAHCFACGFHGDVTDVWAAQRGIERPIEAALDLAREFNVRLPEFSEEGRRKAEEQRAKEEAQRFGAWASHEVLVGSHDGEPPSAPAVRKWWEERGFGSDLRERFLLGANRDGTEAVIPFWNRGRVVGLIRRKLEGEPKYILPNVEEFSQGYRPLFIPIPLGSDIFVVEGHIDALAVAASGRSAVAIGGTGVSKAQRKELRQIISSGANLYILPDADAPGAVAAREWGRSFFPHGRVCQAAYGEGAKDIADTFAREGSAATADLLDRLAATSKDALDLEIEIAADLESGPRERAAYAMENIVPFSRRSGTML